MLKTQRIPQQLRLTKSTHCTQQWRDHCISVYYSVRCAIHNHPQVSYVCQETRHTFIITHSHWYFPPETKKKPLALLLLFPSDNVKPPETGCVLVGQDQSSKSEHTRRIIMQCSQPQPWATCLTLIKNFNVQLPIPMLSHCQYPYPTQFAIKLSNSASLQ